MKNKSEVCQHLIQFCNMVETQFEKRVKRIRSDNGLEFQTKPLFEYYGRRGIICETSCTDTPQQNGVVERKHRHILEVARALRFQSGLPIDFWGECILTAVYIINRLPSPIISNKSPCEMLFGKIPSYEHLRVFGCLVYAHDNKRKDKFGERGSPCIFLGYPYGQKAYRVFDLRKQDIYSSRDVTFFENEFPFKLIEQEGHDFGFIVNQVYNKVIENCSTSHVQPKPRSRHLQEGFDLPSTRSPSDYYSPMKTPSGRVEPPNCHPTTPSPKVSHETNWRPGPPVVCPPICRRQDQQQEKDCTDVDTGSATCPLVPAEQVNFRPSTLERSNQIDVGPDPLHIASSGRPHNMAAPWLHSPTAHLPSPQAVSKDQDDNGALDSEFESTDFVPTTNEVRRSDRIRRLPSHLAAFDTDLPPSLTHSRPANSAGSTQYPISNFLNYERFSTKHRAFLVAISSHNEPKTFSQAVQNPLWREAMQKEIQALEENGTWTLVHLPSNKKLVDSKWVYKIKYKPNGEVERYKARLVAKGFTQVEGVDFHETFAPVAKLVTVRCLLAVAAKKHWEVHQLDVNNAFLHGDLSEDVYMRVPQGFSKNGDTRVCKLQKSLYGLRQASRNWYHKFTQSLLKVGFRQSHADHSLFIFRRGLVQTFALIYVDDVILAGNDVSHINDTKRHLDENFSIKDLGPLKYFLGIEVARSPKGFVLSQRKYTLDILNECGLLAGRPSLFPMEQNLKLRPDDDSPLVDASSYRRLIGRLLYLTVTRPDIVFSVSQLSQFLHKPRQTHLDAAIRVLRYLKQTPGQGIFLSADGDFTLKAYCDADWAGCSFTRRSSTGYFIALGSSPISWRTKKQSVVSRSSAEAEYRAMAVTVSEILWLRWLLRDLTVHQSSPTSLFCDNQAARHIALNPVFHERTKHVEIDCHFVRERVASGEINPCYISTTHQTADIFTKALGTDRFQFLRNKLGVCDLHTPT
ncbi:unnamed protein product [Cuscuta epithymum]|uniref:Integrase catalytic domain-containing protein n=1 Tax=Cuscuta epithymum TaxID=186058 RepID=A0AAV0FCY9_9ASTE|nr:unnamed protein product [Cuscuta epithymum]